MTVALAAVLAVAPATAQPPLYDVIAGSESEYVVAPGDNAWAITGRFTMTRALFDAWNPLPDPASLDAAARILAASERPLVITSSAGRTRAGFDALTEFATRFAVPVISFTPRFVNIAADHPMHCGYEPGPLLAEADCVLVLDTDVPWIPHLQGPPSGCKVIHLGEDPLFARYPMRNFPMDLTITADPATGLNGIAAALSPLLPEGTPALAQRSAYYGALSRKQRDAGGGESASCNRRCGASRGLGALRPGSAHPGCRRCAAASRWPGPVDRSTRKNLKISMNGEPKKLSVFCFFWKVFD